MALETQLVPDLPYEASADLSSEQFYAVVIDGNGQVALASNTSKINGILQDTPAAAGRACAVRSIGISKCILGGTVNEGDTLGVSSAGTLVAIDTANVTDRWAAGTSLTNGISGETGSIELNIQYIGG